MTAEEAAQEWFSFAEMDWLTAQHLYEKFSPMPREIICFHCQQAIEKFLKGILISMELPMLKTHDLTVLVESLPDGISIPDEYKKTCAKLTVYATTTRYPMELRMEEYQVINAIHDTAEVYQWLSDYIEKNRVEGEKENAGCRREEI